MILRAQQGVHGCLVAGLSNPVVSSCRWYQMVSCDSERQLIAWVCLGSFVVSQCCVVRSGSSTAALSLSRSNPGSYVERLTRTYSAQNEYVSMMISRDVDMIGWSKGRKDGLADVTARDARSSTPPKLSRSHIPQTIHDTPRNRVCRTKRP